MVSPIASYVVSLGTDGRVASQGSVAEAMANDKEMQAEAEESEEALKKADQEEATEMKGEETKKSDGKLVVAEEIAEGHVSWAAGEYCP